MSRERAFLQLRCVIRRGLGAKDVERAFCTRRKACVMCIAHIERLVSLQTEYEHDETCLDSHCSSSVTSSSCASGCEYIYSVLPALELT
jgi:hypothetical protein